MNRRLVSLLLAVCLLLPWQTTFAASSPVSITSQDVTGQVGETVSVALQIAIEPPKLGQTMDSLQFSLEYDSSLLAFYDIQELYGDYINILGARYLCSVTPSMGRVAFAASASAGTNGSGTLMHVRFTVLSTGSAMLALKKVSYSFVTIGSETASQRTYTGGAMNLGYVKGESNPFASPSTSAVAESSEEPAQTEPPRYPVTEITDSPPTSPSPTPAAQRGDALAYMMFGLFLLVAVLICVLLTLMIVRRGRRRSTLLLEEDEEELPPNQSEGPQPKEPGEEEEQKPEEFISVIRRRKGPES